MLDRPSNQRVAQQYLRNSRTGAKLSFAKSFDPAHWDLQSLFANQPTTLYHGTTAQFNQFSAQKSRTELVDNYYGAGIFLTPSKDVAEQYARANRNAGFPPSIIQDLKTQHAKQFVQDLVHHGAQAWERYSREALHLGPQEDYFEVLFKLLGADPNDLADIARYIIGSRSKVDLEDDSLELLMSGRSSAMPHYMYDTLDSVGINSAKYRPKVYTVSVTAKNILATSSKSQAKQARNKGYDCVVYYGSDLVSGVPEVAVFNANQVHITSVELAD